MSETFVSVIVPSYKSARTLYSCLEAVTKQDTSWGYDVVVVHSGTEPIPNDVLHVFNSVTFHIFKERWLPGKARNWAVKRVHSPWIMFLDSDCIVDEDWIETFVSEAIRQDADGIGGGIRNATPISLISWTMHLLEFGEWLPHGKSRTCENFPSCNALYRRSALIQVGGFPEDLFPCEDTVLNHVLRQSGFKLMFVPECAIGHIHYKNLITLLQHNYAHGLAYGRACHTSRLPGHFLIHLNWALALLVVVPVRFVRIFLRVIPQYMLLLPILTISIPLVLLGLIGWGIGFINAGKHQSAEFFHKFRHSDDEQEDFGDCTLS